MKHLRNNNFLHHSNKISTTRLARETLAKLGDICKNGTHRPIHQPELMISTPPESLAKQGPITTVETISNSKPSEKAGKTSLKKNLFIFHPRPQSGNCFILREFLPLKSASSLWKSMVGRFSQFPFGTAYFQRRPVNFQRV